MEEIPGEVLSLLVSIMVFRDLIFLNQLVFFSVKNRISNTPFITKENDPIAISKKNLSSWSDRNSIHLNEASTLTMMTTGPLQNQVKNDVF